jgi:glutaredoxin 2
MNYKLFMPKHKICLPDFHGTISRCITNISALMPFNKKKDTSAGEFEHTVKDPSEGYSSGTEIDMDKW